MEVMVDKTQATFRLREGEPVEIKIYDTLYRIDSKGVRLPLLSQTL